MRSARASAVCLAAWDGQHLSARQAGKGNEEICVSCLTQGRLDGQRPPAPQGAVARLQEVVIAVNADRSEEVDPGAVERRPSYGGPRVRRHLPQRNTRYQAGATPFPGRTFTGWTAPASPGAPLLLHRSGLAPPTLCRFRPAHQKSRLPEIFCTPARSMGYNLHKIRSKVGYLQLMVVRVSYRGKASLVVV